MATTQSDRAVEHTTTIAASPEEAYLLVADFRRWAEWSPWEDLESAQ